MQLFGKSLLILVMLTASPGLRAAEFCAIDSVQIQLFLNAAATNGEADVIRIPVGDYALPASGGFNYLPGPLAAGESADLQISGGWSDFFGNPCGQQLSPSAFDTMLDGEGQERILNIQLQQSGDITISNLWFFDGFADPQAFQRGGGLQIRGLEGYLGDIRVSNNVFSANVARFGAALEISRGDRVQVDNNLFLANQSSEAYVVEVVIDNTLGLYFNNNTVFSNQAANSTIGGVYLAASGSSQLFVANNILWTNEDLDLRLAGSGIRHLYNNTIQTLDGVADFEANNVQIAPQFAGGLLNFHLDPASPLVDAGRMPPAVPMPPEPFEDDWQLNPTDLDGDPRVQGEVVDIGAYESPSALIFSDGFED